MSKTNVNESGTIELVSLVNLDTVTGGVSREIGGGNDLDDAIPLGPNRKPLSPTFPKPGRNLGSF